MMSKAVRKNALRLFAHRMTALLVVGRFWFDVRNLRSAGKQRLHRRVSTGNIAGMISDDNASFANRDSPGAIGVFVWYASS